ncbi:exported protein of unknown function [Nitrospira sp. KM1]|nr:exported protein of unknown function [Nitrospira sp. KM1]
MSMPHRSVRHAVMAIMVGAALSGCLRWIDVNPPMSPQSESPSLAIPTAERVPLVIEGLRVAQNGAPQNPPAEVERRVLNTIQETRLFSTLVPLGGNLPSSGEKIINARISFDESIDPHSGESAWKGFLIGASMFLLSPAIGLEYDFAAHVTLELERWDGQVKRYEANSAGTAHYSLFAASPIMIDELKGQVTEACLGQLMSQMVRDTGFYVASSSPLPDPAIRSVTVKARRTAPGTSSKVPVSTVTKP